MSRGPWRRSAPGTAIRTVDDLPYICTTAEAGQLLRLTPENVMRKVSRGIIPGYKEGKEWRIRRSDLLEYIEGKVRA